MDIQKKVSGIIKHRISVITVFIFVIILLAIYVPIHYLENLLPFLIIIEIVLLLYSIYTHIPPLPPPPPPEPQDEDGLKDYLSSLLNELNYLPVGLGLGRRIGLNDIYVWVNLRNYGESRDKIVKDSELITLLLEDKNKRHQNALFIGGPGSGKSTLIRRWAYNIANDAINELTDYIPIFIPLNIISQLPENQMNLNWKLEELALKQIYGVQYTPKNNILSAIKDKISQGKIIIFLDAADEVPEDRRDFIENWINSISNIHADILIILTSRPCSFVERFKIFEQYNMVDFNDEQIDSFVNLWFSSVTLDNNKTEIIDFVKNSDRIISSNPLFLTMLCVIFESGKEEKIPTPGALFERFIYELLEYRPRRARRPLKVSTPIKLSILQIVASKLFANNRKTIQEGQLIDLVNNTKKEIDIGTAIQEIVETSGILQVRRNGYYSFYHPLFQEFFVARKIKEELIKEKDLNKCLKEWFKKFGQDERYEKINGFLPELIDLDKKEEMI